MHYIIHLFCLLLFFPLSRVQIVCRHTFLNCDCTACLWRIVAIPGQACGVISTQELALCKWASYSPSSRKVWDSVLPVCLPRSAVSLFERSEGNTGHPAGWYGLTFQTLSGKQFVFWSTAILYLEAFMCIVYLLLNQVLHRFVLWENQDLTQKVNSEWVLLRKPLKVASAEYMGNILCSWYDTLFFVVLCIFIKGETKLTCYLSEEMRFLHLVFFIILNGPSGLKSHYLREMPWLR